MEKRLERDEGRTGMEDVIRKIFSIRLDKDINDVKIFLAMILFTVSVVIPVYKGIGQITDGLTIGTGKVLFAVGYKA